MMHVSPSSFFADRMFRVANLIAPLTPISFNMAAWTKHECGSPSCMAGHAVWLDMFGKPVAAVLAEDDYQKALREYRRVSDSCGDMIGYTASRYFGIDPDTAHVLFVPAIQNLHEGRTTPVFEQDKDDSDERKRISGRWAANTLRHLASEGVVDWTKMKEAA